MTTGCPDPLSDMQLRNLITAVERLRRARDDAEEALLAAETLLGLAKRRRAAAPVIPLRPAGNG